MGKSSKFGPAQALELAGWVISYRDQMNTGKWERNTLAAIARDPQFSEFSRGGALIVWLEGAVLRDGQFVP